VLGRRGWTFGGYGAVTSVAVNDRVQVTSTDGVMACVKAGLGISVVSLA
jgi:hypothetical protein